MYTTETVITWYLNTPFQIQLRVVKQINRRKTVKILKNQ